MSPQSISAEWKRSCTPTGSVFSSSAAMRIRVKMKSFHARMKVKMEVAMIPGRASGRMTKIDRAQPAGPVHHRRLLQLDRDRLEERPQQPEREGKAERGEGQDQGEVGVLDPDLLHQDEERDHHHDGSEHVGAQDQAGDLLAPRVAVSGETVGPGGAHRHRQEDRQARHDQAVPEVGEEIGRREQSLEVLPGRRPAGMKVGGWAKTSAGGLKEVETIQRKGKAAWQHEEQRRLRSTRRTCGSRVVRQVASGFIRCPPPRGTARSRMTVQTIRMANMITARAAPRPAW